MARLPSLILASASPRRQELLRTLHPKFRVIPSAAEELLCDELTACETSRVNAVRKALEVAQRFPQALVIGADTLVFLDTHIFGKPRSQSEAVRMLEQLQGRTHHVVTGVCLLHLASHARMVFEDVTAVTFLPLGKRQIKDYLNRVDPLDKAGAYAIQEHGDRIVAAVAGSYSNVVGLPLELLADALELFQKRLVKAK